MWYSSQNDVETETCAMNRLRVRSPQLDFFFKYKEKFKVDEKVIKYI